MKVTLTKRPGKRPRLNGIPFWPHERKLILTLIKEGKL